MLTAYSPLAKGRVVDNDVLTEVGRRHGKTAAQVALRWLLQQDMVTAIPKASSQAHIEENFDIFDFELTSDEMAEILGSQLTENRNTWSCSVFIFITTVQW